MRTWLWRTLSGRPQAAYRFFTGPVSAFAEIGALAENLGFSPIKLGGLSEGGLLVRARGNSWGQLILKDLVKFD